jgi:hypothetical protein
MAYALSRPVLRRVMHVDTPSAQEARLIDDTTRHVDTYGTHGAQRDAQIDHLLRAQRDDGGWSLEAMGGSTRLYAA